MPSATAGSDGQLAVARAVIKRLEGELRTARGQIELLTKRNRELGELAICDELTGLYNQRHFYDRLKQEVESSRRQEHALCLLFFDVDGLKTYNDTRGHSGGNDVLKAVSRSLSRSIRENVDSGYRYGGDEFAVVFPGMRAEQAAEVARNINEGLREAGFQDVTLSFGIAELGSEMDGEALLRCADDAMYMAKRRARSGSHGDKIYVYDRNATSHESSREGRE